MEVVLDSSVLVGILAPRDKWHHQAVALWEAIKENGHIVIYLDCVVSESVSAAARRLYEQKRADEIQALLGRLQAEFTTDVITWVLTDVPRLYSPIINLMKSSGGELNFNDALIALACRERNIPAIASFDADFDNVSWLRRLATPGDLMSNR
jgi:predicted nucleic acid-binding protein